MKKKAKIDTAAGGLDAVLKVRLSSDEKAAILALADRAQMTVSALARRRLTGAKVAFRPSLAAMEHLRRACVLARARRASWTAEREALGAAHREQRDALWRSVPPGGWRGRGAELNAGRSLLAARQAGERAALLERQRRERRDLSGAAEAGREAEREIGSEGARRPAEQSGASDRRRARLVALILLEEEEETAERPRDIRDFVAVIRGGRVDYRRADDPGGPAGFADRGGEIAVHAERDRDTVRAALQLAAQKWGRFRVEGDDEYRALCAGVAAECGLPLGEPEPLEAPRWPGPAADHRTGPAP